MISQDTVTLLVFRYSTKDYCIQQAKPQLDANRPKSPHPPLFCLLVRYSANIISHDITLPNHILCIIQHLIEDLAEKPPSPSQEGKKFKTGSIHLMQFPATLVQLAEKPPTPPPPPPKGSDKTLLCIWNKDGPQGINPC